MEMSKRQGEIWSGALGRRQGWVCTFKSFAYVSVKATDKADMRRERVATSKRRLHALRRLIFNGWVRRRILTGNADVTT